MKKAVLFIGLILVFSVFVYSQNDLQNPAVAPDAGISERSVDVAESADNLLVEPAVKSKRNFKKEKVHPRLHNAVDADDSIEMIVQFDKKPNKQLRKKLENNGCRVKYSARRMNLVVVECLGGSIADISNDNDVKYLWENEEFAFALDYSAGQIYADDAWTSGYNGSGVNVSVIDTGINWSSHPALENSVILEEDFTTEGITEDRCGHGTPVASVIASVNDTYKGIAHGASLFNAKAGKILSTGPCGVSAYDAIEAIDWSVANGAQVISMSIGSYTPVGCDGSITANYVNQTVIQDNIPIVIAAGNNGPSAETINIPGCAENAITVGAVSDMNEIASFSSRGPAHYEDGRTWVKPDVVAPGIGIMSADANGPGFSPRDGTSMATPHVAAVVALMFQANPYLGQYDVKSILHNTSIDLGYDENTQGHGLVNASAAVELAASLNISPPVIPPPVLAVSKSVSPDPVFEGSQIFYSLFINNTGNGSAYSVNVTEFYPLGVVFDSSSPSPSSGNNIFSLGNLSAGAGIVINITVNVTIDVFENGTVLNNSFIVDFAHANGTVYSAGANVSSVVQTLPNYPGILVYYSENGNSDMPKSRNITDASTLMSQEELLSLDPGAHFARAVWLDVEESPVRSENILVTLDNLNDVNVQVVGKLGANNRKELTIDAGGFGEKRTDAVYDSAGRAMIVYANNSAIPAYEIWNGSAYVESGVLSSSSCISNTTWIVLAQKPGASEMVAVYQDSSGRYCGQVWNGTAWSNVKLFGNDSGTSTQKFDVAYEQSSGQALVVFETPAAGVLGYCAWNGTDWCSNITTLNDRGSQNTWVRLASQRGSDRLLVGVLQDGDGDVESIEWDGSSFGTWKTIDGGVETAGDRTMDVAYVGASGKALVVYDNSNADVPSFATCSNASACFAGTWSSTSATTNTSNNCGEASDLDYVGLAEDPVSDKVLLYASSQSNHFKCAQFYDGSWGSWSSSLGSGYASLSGEEISAVFDSG